MVENSSEADSDAQGRTSIALVARFAAVYEAEEKQRVFAPVVRDFAYPGSTPLFNMAPVLWLAEDEVAEDGRFADSDAQGGTDIDMVNLFSAAYEARRVMEITPAITGRSSGAPDTVFGSETGVFERSAGVMVAKTIPGVPGSSSGISAPASGSETGVFERWAGLDLVKRTIPGALSTLSGVPDPVFGSETGESERRAGLGPVMRTTEGAATALKRKRGEEQPGDLPEARRVRRDGDLPAPSMRARRRPGTVRRRRRLPVKFPGFERPAELTWEQVVAAGGVAGPVGGPVVGAGPVGGGVDTADPGPVGAWGTWGALAHPLFRVSRRRRPVGGAVSGGGGGVKKPQFERWGPRGGGIPNLEVGDGQLDRLHQYMHRKTGTWFQVPAPAVGVSPSPSAIFTPVG